MFAKKFFCICSLCGCVFQCLYSQDGDSQIAKNPELAAFLHYSFGNYESTLSYFDTILDREPANLKAYLNKARVLCALGNQEVQGEKYYAQVVSCMEKFAELGNVSPETYFYCGYSRLKMSDLNGALRDFNNGIELLENDVDPSITLSFIQEKENAIRMQEKEYKAYLKLAAFDRDMYFRMNDHIVEKEALTLLINTYNKNTLFNKLLFLRGYVYTVLMDYDKAIRDITESLKFDLEKEEIKKLLAYGYLKKGEQLLLKEDYNSAIETFTHIINSESYRNDAWLFRGIAYFYNGRIAESISDYTYCINTNTASAVAYYCRALAYIKLKEYENSLGDLDMSIELNPNPDNNNAYYNRGVVYNILGNPNAVDDFRLLTEREPDVFKYQYELGNAYIKNGEHRKAIIAFKSAKDINSTDHNPYVNLGYCYYILGYYHWALTELNKALELNTNHYAAYKYRSLVYRDLEDYVHALEDLDTVIKLFPDKIREAHFYKGIISEKMGSVSLALNHYRLCVKESNEQQCPYSSFAKKRITELNHGGE